MAATVCPTITTDDPHEFRSQMELVTSFAGRIHIDVADGKFTPNKLIDLNRVWWPANVTVDIHIMYQDPGKYVDQLLALHPQLVIVHAEAEGDFDVMAAALHAKGIEVGVALLPDTPASLLRQAIKDVDHVLIFSGNIGHFGGTANLDLLQKIQELRNLKPTLEIGWDGGVNADNAKVLARSGIDVLDVGGFIHRASDPYHAYQMLTSLL